MISDAVSHLVVVKSFEVKLPNLEGERDYNLFLKLQSTMMGNTPREEKCNVQQKAGLGLRTAR